MANEFAFLPWVRTALVVRAGAPATGSARRVVNVGMQVVANDADQGTPAMTKIELYDTGDVKTFEQTLVARVEPEPRARGVEPNYFPYIEFFDADLPWRHTLDVSTGSRVIPWLALIALRPEEFRFVPRVGAPFPVIEVTSPVVSLPDLDNAWAWAHVQVNLTGAGGATVAEVVRTNPGAHFSRLFCTRKLQAETSYHLFLVPVYESGRLRGIGDSTKPATWNAFAWTAATVSPLRLPYFHDWYFSTSAAEDFESLIRRITPIDLDAVGATREALGVNRVRGGETGYYATYLEPAVTFQLEGALRTPLADDRREPFAADGLTLRLVTTLNASLATPIEVSLAASQAGEDPLYTLPAYGHHFKRTTAIAAPATGDAWPAPNKWVNEVNLDRRHRLAAGAGARVVRKYQEEFMAIAWQQASEIAKANRLLAQATTATILGAVFEQKHLAPLDPNILVALGDPVVDIVPAGSVNPGKTLGAAIRVRGMPSGVGTLDERRVLAKRPQTIKLPGGAAARGTLRKSVRSAGAQPLPGAEYGDSAVAGAKSSPGMGRKSPRTAAQRKSLRSDWGFSVFPNLDRDGAAVFLSSTGVARRTTFEMQRTSARPLADGLLTTLRNNPALRVAHAIQGLAAGGTGSLASLYYGPRIPEAMYSYLIEQNPDLMLPGIADLPDDSAGLLVENRRVIEAFLLGCNHEMNRELLWREYPADLRSTVFARFWERGAEPGDLPADDIKPITSWNAALGLNAPGQRGENIVLVLRGELLKRFPGLMIVLNKQTLQNGEWLSGAGTDTPPDFWGWMGDDIGFFGFPLTEAQLRQDQDRYFFVIYEPMGRYRFGLDIANYGTRAARRDLRKASVAFPTLVSSPTMRGVSVSKRVLGAAAPSAAPALAKWDDLSWEHVTVSPTGYVDFSVAVHPTAGDTGQWSAAGNSATIASVTFQKPMRVVISALRMISDA